MLTNLTELTNYQTMPHKEDTSQSADLMRIKHYRNLISHKEDDKIDNSLFNKAWDDIIEVLLTHCIINVETVVYLITPILYIIYGMFEFDINGTLVWFHFVWFCLSAYT